MTGTMARSKQEQSRQTDDANLAVSMNRGVYFFQNRSPTVLRSI